MMEQQKSEILQETTQMMDQKIIASEQRMITAMDSKVQESERRMIAAMDSKKQESERRMMVMMESYFDPKFQLLSEQITGQMQGKASVEVVQDLDDRVSDLEDDVLQLKKAQ